MRWLEVLRLKGSPEKPEEKVIDVTTNSSVPVQVTLSIHQAKPTDSYLGAALCIISKPGRVDTTGSIVHIGRRPHPLKPNQFLQLLQQAGEMGHLDDGFLEIEAQVDMNRGTVVWNPEDGDGVDLAYLDEIVENTVTSLVESNLLGEWFVLSSCDRRSRLVNLK